MRLSSGFKMVLVVLVVLLHIGHGTFAKTPLENHLEVGLRMIGHQLLLANGNDTSRVMPITYEFGTYRIAFEDELIIMPDSLNDIVARVLAKADLTTNYSIQVQECISGDVVYAYEVGLTDSTTTIPCRGRALPKGCYYILFYDASESQIAANETEPTEGGGFNWFYVLIVFLCMIPVFAVLYFSQKKKAAKPNPNEISIGKYRFDKIRGELIIAEQRIELTGKESDLLMLLYETANHTVEREVLLNKVWGDEGDYIGRTLDVFISKLRKKLEFDSGIKIVNVRGVGYKLVMDI